MNLDAFQRDRAPSWGRLETLLGEARGRPERLGPAGVRELGALYRSAAADLALARRRFPRDPVRARLEDLVGRARPAVYAAPARRGSLRHFLVRGYWLRVRERPRPLLLAWALLVLPALLAGLWAGGDPGAGIGLVPEQFRAAVDPPEAGTGRSAAELAEFSSTVFTNNIRVTFLAFAGGLAGGLVTAALLISNGLTLGAIAGVAAASGTGPDLLAFVIGHGILEFSCVVVAAAAGLRVGWALIEPGRRGRAEALATEARRAVEIVLGTVPWLVLTGLVEGYVSRTGLPLEVVAPVGVGLGVLYWSLVLVRGRPSSTGVLAPSP